MEKRTRFDKTLYMLLWLNFFGAGSVLSASLTWGFINAIKQSDGHVVPAHLIIAALATTASASTLYAAFKAFHTFTANQKTASTEA